ncbi:MAG: L,D-transpeptidase family protein [Bacteroidales bacterium]|nr:L,D-transpeptidase family protein [Bacteroidales bacterium]MBN2757002.1 L,D-transpeptidase family protein [Bacteroidales bacterium]
MKTGLKLNAILLIISILFVSCFERNNYKVTRQYENLSQENYALIQNLESTLKNINDSVKFAYRGNELSTSKQIKELYVLNQFLPIWTDNMKPNHFARELIRLFAKSSFYGLDTSFYNFSELKTLYYSLEDKNDKNSLDKAIEFEILLTHNCYKIMSHLYSGVIKPDTLIYGRKIINFPKDFPQKLSSLINTDYLTEGILDLQPKSIEYIALQKGLEKFLRNTLLYNDSLYLPDPNVDSTLAYDITKEILTKNKYYQPQKYVDAYVNCRVNEITNYLSDTIGYKISFDVEYNSDTLFVSALKEFQKDNGLNGDGLIGLNTRKALIMTNMDRFEQIAINLERLRWEQKRPSKYVYVNIPSYKLSLIEKNKIKKTYKVVVGAISTPTPELNSQIEYLITNPTWNVPASISKNELLPKIKSDPEYLKKHNYKILDENRLPINNDINWTEVNNDNFNYFIRQSSGSDNALGNLKFIFPNPYHVYIHDTQSKSKFYNDIRAYSHGCMRIEKPISFANDLLKSEQKEVTDTFNIVMEKGIRKIINLSKPVPVYVRYITCEADENSNIIFYKDIYKKDETLKKQLFSKSSI